MKNILFFKKYQQYYVRFKYESKSYTRYCIVPISWKFKDVEKYLRTIFTKKKFAILKYSQRLVYLFNEKEVIVKKVDDWNIGLYWRDAIQWEIEMKNKNEYLEIVIVTESYTTEKELFKRIKEDYPLVQQISTVYQTECWVKNDNY